MEIHLNRVFEEGEGEGGKVGSGHFQWSEFGLLRIELIQIMQCHTCVGKSINSACLGGERERIRPVMDIK